MLLFKYIFCKKSHHEWNSMLIWEQKTPSWTWRKKNWDSESEEIKFTLKFQFSLSPISNSEGEFSLTAVYYRPMHQTESIKVLFSFLKITFSLVDRSLQTISRRKNCPFILLRNAQTKNECRKFSGEFFSLTRWHTNSRSRFSVCELPQTIMRR